MSDEAEDVGIWLSKACPPKSLQIPGSCNRRTPKALPKKFSSCKMKMNHLGGGLISAFLTQNSPPPPQLVTAKKQSTLTDFFSRHGKILPEHQSNNLKDQADNDGENSTSAELELLPEVLTDLPTPTVEFSSLNSTVPPNQTLTKQTRQDEYKTKVNLNKSVKVKNDTWESSLQHGICFNPAGGTSNERIDRCDQTKIVLEKRKILEDVDMNSLMNLPRKKVKTPNNIELSSSSESVQPYRLHSKDDQNSSQFLNQSVGKWNIEENASISLFEGSGDTLCFSDVCDVAGENPEGKMSSTLLLTESCSLDFSVGEVSARTACLPHLSQDDQFKHRKEKYLLELGQLEFTDNE